MNAYGMTIAWGLEKPLTVREARWVGRLYHVLTDIEELTMVARECALDEVSSEPTGLINADFVTRAITGKPGVTYKYLGDGDFQLILHHRGVYDIDIQLPPNQES
jgi:hypothetical protein